MAGTFGTGRLGVVARELTKTYEQVIRAPLGELAAVAATAGWRGEIVIVVAGATDAASGSVSVDDVVGQATARVAAGERLKEVVAELATVHGLRKRDLYAAAVIRPAAEVVPQPAK
jgi:16S rRNA (cytidine1402-2'-O)-methyltransferase